MEKIKNSFKHLIENVFLIDIYYYLTLSILIILSYWQIIIKDVVLSYDDSILLTSLSSISSISHYFSSIYTGLVLDIQPVRDISFFIDLKLKAIIPFYSFHFTNVLIWILICINVRKLFLSRENKNYYIVGLLVFLYALSPISGNSVAWIAARKHLLSTLFITYATLIVIKHKNNLALNKILLITFLYFLSCFSHPINTLWIIWLCYSIYPFNKVKNSLKVIISSSVICLISIFSNLYYYKIIFANNVSTSSKFMNLKTLDFGDPILALGRYFYQCINPFAALPSSHYQGSWENLLGITLLVLFLAFCYKRIKQSDSSLIAPLIYFFFPLIIVTVNMTNIFCSDTYLLNSSIGFYWAILIISESFQYKKLFTYLLGFYVFIVACYNIQYIQIFTDEDQLWLYSQKKEANSQSTVIASSIYIKQKRFHESFLLIERIQNQWPNQPYLPQLIAENIFYNPNIDPLIKINKMLEINPKMPSTYLYLSILYAYQDNKSELEKVLFLVLDDPMKFSMEFKGNENKIAAVFLYTCQYFNFNECSNHLEQFKKKASYGNWNNKEIQTYIRDLNKSIKYQINL